MTIADDPHSRWSSDPVEVHISFLHRASVDKKNRKIHAVNIHTLFLSIYKHF